MSKLGKILFLVAGISILILFTARIILGGWIEYLWVPLGVGLLAFVGALVVDYKLYLEFLSMRTTKHGMNMGVMILLVLGLAVAVNYLGSRYNKSIDVTKEKLNSLSDQSIEVVKSLKGEVNILVFYRGKDNKDLVDQLKGNFQTYLDLSKNIKLKFVNAFEDPELAKRYLSRGDQFTVLVEAGEKRIAVERPYSEEQVTSALVKVSRDREHRVHFLAGHGERDIDSDEGDGIKSFAESLRNDGFTVTKLNLLGGDEMPKAPDIVAIVGPRTALAEMELNKLREFSRSGGRLFIAADPGEKHQIALLTKSLGVEYRNNYVVNNVQDPFGLGPLGVYGLEFSDQSDVTKKLTKSNGAAMFYVISELAKAPEAPASLTIHDIVKSHTIAYAVNNLKVKEPPGERKAHTLAVAVKGHLEPMPEGEKSDKPEFAATIFGDSDFLTAQFFGNFLNSDLALNAMAFLADEAALISIRPKSPEKTPINSTPQREIAIVLSGVGLPLVLLILSGFMWYRRRNL